MSATTPEAKRLYNLAQKHGVPFGTLAYQMSRDTEKAEDVMLAAKAAGYSTVAEYVVALVFGE